MTHAEALHILNLVPGQPLAQVSASFKKLRKQSKNGNHRQSTEELEEAYAFLKKEFVEQRRGNALEKRISNGLLLWFHIHWFKLLTLGFLIPFLWVFAKSSVVRNGVNGFTDNRSFQKKQGYWYIEDEYGRTTNSYPFKRIFGAKPGEELVRAHYLVIDENDKVAVINPDGKILAQADPRIQIDYARPFQDDVALVGKGRKFSLMDVNGFLLYPIVCEFPNVLPFNVLDDQLIKLENNDTIPISFIQLGDGTYESIED